jgi:hypothetical protein
MRGRYHSEFIQYSYNNTVLVRQCFNCFLVYVMERSAVVSIKEFFTRFLQQVCTNS